MTKRHRKSYESAARPLDDGFSTGAGVSPPAPSESEREMAEFGITQDGLRYRYNNYRYDRLADAVAYARLMRSRPTRPDAGGTFTQGSATWVPPTDDERDLMASLGIRLVDGTYRFAEFRYERLVDAVNYARLTLQRQRGDAK